MAKRIVVCCDGTWNTPDEREVNPKATNPAEKVAPTNVTLVAESIARRDEGHGCDQLVFYDTGVGTRAWDHVLGGATGWGLSSKVKEAYMFIAQNYEPGDELYLFGFSRGAYTVRSVAGFIRNSGLLKWCCESRLDDAYVLYRDRSEASHPKTRESALFRTCFSHEPLIKFIGVWDTVGSLGIPTTLRFLSKHWSFHDLDLSSHVKNAFQALAIDEHRKPFQPALWNKQDDAPKSQRLEQVWFPGVHKDVGGGYIQHQLSDLALRWMVDKAKECELVFRLGEPKMGLPDDPCGYLHDSFKCPYKWLGKVWRQIEGKRKDPRKGTPMKTNEKVAESAKTRQHFCRDYRPANLKAYDGAYLDGY
ncbi:MAG TPA: DUF2235 domain-containing protein [Chloroflexota bacterium]